MTSVYKILSSAHDSKRNLLRRAFVDDLRQLKHSRVLVLSYNSSEKMPITLWKTKFEPKSHLLENDSRFRFQFLKPVIRLLLRTK
ncbi:hypothetical protein TNCV_2872541 [Trichonephila clavipes]|nr:hypothetical protein TNCV_2872541 [Trichonephila clavipes]